MSNDPVRVFVGTDRSQLLAVKILEHSIKRHTGLEVEVTPMLDLPTPIPKDPRHWQRTGFSFSRFCIPELADRKGKAIYMDADMLVFKDIKELWNIPFEGSKMIVQETLPKEHVARKKYGSPTQRVPQSAVMLLDCERLNWDIKEIIQGFDEEKYDYPKLMYDFCLMKDDEIHFGIPWHWNSLEHIDESTSLVHYTDMATQPWVSNNNDFSDPWLDEVRLMLKNGSLDVKELENEINIGYFRPSLKRDILSTPPVKKTIRRKLWDLKNQWVDKKSLFRMHKDVYQNKRIRKEAEKKYLDSLKTVKV